ncbi:MAG TPA: DUF6067 family protein [Candidatus Hydrogenedentes bacterium]|nr:DUF6067 family protein [Candidatus Hydrogenedentota bacterium]
MVYVRYAIFAVTIGWVGVAGAQTIPVPNASFETGDAVPAQWTLSGGAGTWLMEGSDGAHAIAVTGTGASGETNYWRSETLPLEPFTVYQLRFKARRVDGMGGCPITGPDFCNRDLGELSNEWKSYTSIFITPTQLTPEESYIRFGQWEVKGTVAYDAVELVRVQPVYAERDTIMLGDGESIRGKEYTFNARLNGNSGNHARPLAENKCNFNTPRWCFGPGSSLVYRHRIDRLAQEKASVEVNVGLYGSGMLLVEASIEGEAWRELGKLDSEKTGSFAIPTDMLPQKEVWVRLSVKEGSLQVHGYTYHATLDKEAGEWHGATHFAAVLQQDPCLHVVIERVGEEIPGGDTLFKARAINMSGQKIALHPTLTVIPEQGAAETFEGCMISTQRVPESGQVLPKEKAMTQVQIPYELSATGPMLIRFSLGNESPYNTEIPIKVAELFNSSFGETLPQSSDRVGLWWASSGWKISQKRPLPKAHGECLQIKTAKNEMEAAQLVVRPSKPLKGFLAKTEALKGPADAVIPAEDVEVLRVRYVNVTQPTDYTSVAASWPDPLPPFKGAIDLAENMNQPLWVRVKPPKETPAGVYKGMIALTAEHFKKEVPIEVTVFDFTLPDTMTCTTAFGFGHGRAFQYHKVTDPQQQRAVYEKYLAALSAHHIGPYNPAALDPFKVTWDKLTPAFDWAAWDAAMTKAFDHYHFNGFVVSFPGMGGGTFYSRDEPSLFGYAENTPEYKAAFTAYGNQLNAHLVEKGWADKSYVYWFDEPDPKDYEFVMNGFRKIKEAAPNVGRMLTEQVEPALVGGPNIWCPLTPAFDVTLAQQRQAEGDKFWWYVCTGPKAPYVTLFIDHPGTELRVWLWQTWQRRIQGILVWETNYWSSDAAYPDSAYPQNPYEDPMGWTSGYGTPAGTRLPWGNGDGRFIYPPEAAADGNPAQPVLDPPVDSIRIEMLRDGLEDYEYFTMLEKLLAEKGAKLPGEEVVSYKALLAVPAEVTTDLTHFSKAPEPLEKHREALAHALEQLLDL